MKQPGKKAWAKGYCVRFYRVVPNNTGLCRRCLLHTVRIRHARSPERAVAAAQHVFQRRHGVASWDHLAHGYEIDGAQREW